MQPAASLDTPLFPELLFERTECRTWASPPDCFLIFIFHPAILRIPQHRLAVIVFLHFIIIAFYYQSASES